MLANKISSFSTIGFKGYQHVKDNTGKNLMRFNYPFDYEKEFCEIEFYKVTPLGNNKYELNETAIARINMPKEGIDVDLQETASIGNEEPFAYRIIRINKESGEETKIADSGIKIFNKDSQSDFKLSKDDNLGVPQYTFVSRNGTTPIVQGAGYLAFPDTQRVGIYYKDFDDPNTGEIYIDKAIQKDMEKQIRTFSNKFGGNLAGMEYNLDYLAQNGYTVQFANPIAGGDNKSSHHYWNKNNFQISDDMGNMENFSSYTKKLFQKGMTYVYDGTFTSEGLEGIHFQYALRWADKNPQTYYWFKMQGLKDSNLGLGVVPKNKENLRHRVINAPFEYDANSNKVVKNKNYDSSKETLFQIYDASQVTEEQLAKLDAPIDTYRNLKSGNPLAINNHDDTLINFVFEINPKEYESRLNDFVKFNKNNQSPVNLNSPDGTILLAQFSNFRIEEKTEGGFVTWDANTDMVKMNYHISGYDEKINEAIVDRAERDYETIMRERGAFEVQDMALQAGKYWTGIVVKDTQTLYTAQTLKSAKDPESIKALIDSGLLPKRAELNESEILNVISGYYNLAPIGQYSKDDTTLKALMKLPLDSLEFAENTVGVLSTSYFSNRATSKETLGLSRFELYKKENPHLVEPYAKNYERANMIFENNIKDFADNILKNLNKHSKESIFDKNGDYTEYGEYVINLVGTSIAKYALLKSLTGDKLKTKILPNGEITYDYKNIKEITTLKSLGINATNPEDEAAQLASLIEKGLDNLTEKDVDYVTESIKTRIQGTDTISFRLAEAMVNKAGLGLAWRLDAAKDVMDQDAVRNVDTSFDDTWQNVIDFWKLFVQKVKEENPHSYIVAEITDMQDLMRDNYGEKPHCYGQMPYDRAQFRTVPDAMIKFLNETGITSEAGYSYFFTDLLKTFSAEFAEGSVDNGDGRCQNFIHKIKELIETRGIDYTRNLFSFAGNHDKPRILHGLSLDMTLFHGFLGIHKDDEGKINYEANRRNRIESLLQLTNSDKYEDLPLEAKLNCDNLDYFRTVSTKAVAMSQVLRNSINDTLPEIVSDEEIKFLKLALVDLTNGNYMDNGINTDLNTVNIKELSSLENALITVAAMAGIGLSENQTREILNFANNRELIEKYLVRGDFSNNPKNAEYLDRNVKMAELVLRGEYSDIPSNEYDYSGYNAYSVAIAAILRESILASNTLSNDTRSNLIKATKGFIKKYNNDFVESKRSELPFKEDASAAMAKNGYAARDMITAVEMLIQQAEYRARKDGVLGENEHFKDVEKILYNIYTHSVEPGIQKSMMLMTYLSALVGIPTMYGGDELGMSGYDEKAKNIYLQCRNALPWSELEEGVFKDFRQKVLKEMNETMQIRTRDGVDALNYGTAYELNTSDWRIPAFMMQDGYGNLTVSVFNATGINPSNRFDYFKHLGIDANNKENFFKENKIESFNTNNPYVPIQPNYDIDYIQLGAGISLPIGLTFLNSDIRDKSIYVVKKILDQKGADTGKLGIFKQGGKISLNGLTAKNGAMILKHVTNIGKKIAFKSNSISINNPYKLVSNPYKNIEKPIEGEKLSIITG